MKQITINDINIHDIGNTYTMAGTIWSSADDSFIAMFPGKTENFDNTSLMAMSLEDWERFIRQTDLLETEIFGTDPKTKQTIKAVWRKTQRNIDAFMQWNVFKRDAYTCRYCGANGIPLTVDHIDLWEVGGATIPENLLTACKKCNKDRGNTPYADWIKSDHYKKRSANLPSTVKLANKGIIKILPDLEKKRVQNIRNR